MIYRKPPGVELWSINRILRRIGLVLVISTGDDEPTRLWIERSATFDARLAREPVSDGH